MISGETRTGFHFEIDEENLNDMEFVDELALVEKDPTNTLHISTVSEMLLGKEQKKNLYSHVKALSPNGKVKVDLFMAEFVDIMNSGDDSKKS